MVSRFIALNGSYDWRTSATARGEAQEPAPLAHPDSIPFELASVLLSTNSFPNEPQVLVGAAPGWVLPRLYIPEGGTSLEEVDHPERHVPFRAALPAIRS